MSPEKITLLEAAGCGDYVEGWLCEGEIVLIISNPWSGDTETGMGREGNITLSREQARELAEWLLKVAA